MNVVFHIISISLFVFGFVEAVVKPKDVKNGGKIVGSTRGLIKDFPFVVILRYMNKISCTGSILDEKYVLTAAHCACLDLKPTPMKPSDLKVQAGIDHLSNANSSQNRNVEDIFVHPNYVVGKLSKHDLALIKVDQPFIVSETVGFLKLDGQGWRQQNSKPITEVCISVGWGASSMSDKEPSKYLKMDYANVTHGEKGCKCAESFQNKRVICIVPGNNSLCQGDSGSPLVCRGKGVGVAHLIEYSTKCEHYGFGRKKEFDCDKKTSLGSYMFICPYLDWIKEYVKTVPAKPKSCRGSLNALQSVLPFIISLILAIIK